MESLRIDSKLQRKFSQAFIPEEESIVSSLSELIADEYVHLQNDNALVLVFYSLQDKETVDYLVKSLNNLSYNIPLENIFKITTKEAMMNELLRVSEENHVDKSCLLIFVLGNCLKQDLIIPENEPERVHNCITIKDVWNYFTADKCKSLRDKPKIFFYQAIEKPIRTTFDNFQSLPPPRAYEFPVEADLLVIFKKTIDPSKRNLFIADMCDNIVDYGKHDDLLGLVSRFQAQEDDPHPVIFSTLTRKFYALPSVARGLMHKYDIEHEESVKLLKTIGHRLDQLQPRPASRQSVDGETPIASDSGKLTPTGAVTPKAAKKPVGSTVSRMRRITETPSTVSDSSTTKRGNRIIKETKTIRWNFSFGK